MPALDLNSGQTSDRRFRSSSEHLLKNPNTLRLVLDVLGRDGSDVHAPSLV